MNINESKGDQITIHWAGLKAGKEGTIGTFIVSPKVHNQLEDEFGNEISIDFEDENVNGKLANFKEVVDAMKATQYGKIAFVESLEERNITIKRQYTENHPALKVGKAAKIRNKVLVAIKDGKISKEEFNTILKEMSTDTGRWIRRNSSYFKVNEEGVSLSTFGKKILSQLPVNEGINEKASPFKIANAKAERIFGEFGVATLGYDQLVRVIDVKLADKLAKKYGESSFMSLSELDMEDLLNKNPKLVKENKENNIENNMKTKFVFESFGDFVESLSTTNESNTLLTEAFKSTQLANLFTRSGKVDKDLAKAFYATTKVKLDLVEDEDLVTIDANTAYKNKQANSIIFYISDTPKDNPYAASDAYYTNKTIPGEGYLLAVASGDNKFYDNAWSRGGGRSLKQVDKGDSSIGINKKYSGWDATGLYNVKRISEVADRAVVINVDLLRQKYSSVNQQLDRSNARKGAIAFKTDKEFKQENMSRYNTILAQKAAALPIDSTVAEAIDKIATQIKDALAAGNKGKYGDIIISVNSKGSEVRLADAANHMSRILDDYQRYVGYVKQNEESVTRYGQAESWYSREIQNYAKSIKDRINQIDSYSYAW